MIGSQWLTLIDENISIFKQRNSTSNNKTISVHSVPHRFISSISRVATRWWLVFYAHATVLFRTERMRYVQQSFVYVVCVPSACSKPNRIQVETLRMFTIRFSIALHIERCAQTNVSRHSNPHSHAVYTFSNKFVSILLISFFFVTTRDISSVFHCVS